MFVKMNVFILIPLVFLIFSGTRVFGDEDLSSQKKIWVTTYNVNSKLPKEDLDLLLGLKKASQDLPDIYAIGLQEVSVLPRIAGIDEPWIVAISRVLYAHDYVEVDSVRTLGILLTVYAKKSQLDQIRNIDSAYTNTGLGGWFGNKGGTAIRMTIKDTSLCFVNSHLAAHDEHYKKRISDYNTIIKKTKFDNWQKILDNDYVIWMGDLNFRVDSYTIDDVHRRVSPATPDMTQVQELFSYDQLNRARKDGLVFSGFKEGPLTFMPTYKFYHGTGNYNLQRKPAWTDRILYRQGPKEGLAVEQLSYTSHPQYVVSDHKPVSSLLSLKFVS